jgi:LysM repeat protein
LLYGYTAQKFRDINGLKSNDVLKVGQRLKTSDCDCPATIGQVNTASPATIASSPTAVVPAAYNVAGGRIETTSATLTARTPAAAAASSPVFAANPQVPVNNSSGLPAALPYNSPSVPGAGQRTASDYDAVVPMSFENTSRSVNGMESRAIGSGTDFGSPVASANRSPLPAPNTPIAYGANQNAAATAPAPTTKAANQRRVHIVTAGESLYGIAKRYGTTPERLRQLNQLGPNDPIMEYQSIYLD